MERALYAKIVKKCGNRLYWEEWATDVAKIAQTHITRISTIVTDTNNAREAREFNRFVKELRASLNESITNEEVIEMLAQHLITRPVFDALFEGYEFAKSNPVSIAMQSVLDALQRHHLEKETDTLEKFYASVKMRASGINTAAGKQKIIVELYDKFFRNAFPRTTQRLGTVYTPVEVVDFIIHSVNGVLWQEFGQTLGSRDVGILDPFTGSGTFITRLMQSGAIRMDELEYKYVNEIEANEIVLLAYYIAAINIESMYHELVGGEYVPFKGICLTDTFSEYSPVEKVSAGNSSLMFHNSQRRKRQNDSRIKVIIGNPPYSVGQKSENDNAKNITYQDLDSRIRDTYAKYSSARLVRNLYDSYIRSIRWASDRIGQEGIIGYITNASWIDANAMDGLRKCLSEEFSDIWIFHLRGNARTSGEQRRKEKGNIFGLGSRAPVAITVLAKNPRAKRRGEIRYHDIGDYLSREEKLDIIRRFKGIGGISNSKWRRIVPDRNHDWLNQSDPNFNRFLPIGTKEYKTTPRIFANYSLGVVTNRDAWCYSPSRSLLRKNVSSMIDFYNLERRRYIGAVSSGLDASVDSFINTDSTKISWTRALKAELKKGKPISMDHGQVVVSTYRPFQKQWMYFSRRLNEMVYQMPQIFPHPAAKNRVIIVTGVGATTGFSTLMVDTIPSLNLLGIGQCFPLKLYSFSGDLFSSTDSHPEFEVSDGITDQGLEYFAQAYPTETICKDDAFYFLYALFHSEDYRAMFKNNLAKQLPRIPPPPPRFPHFREFVKAGRNLAELHVHYEHIDPWPVDINNGDDLPSDIDRSSLFRVKKMRFGGDGRDQDKTTIIYNDHITVSNIPVEAYKYVVNGKSALEWIMDRQRVKTDKASKIESDPNRYAIETVGNEAYPLELLQRIITVSMRTLAIIDSLPRLNVDDE